MLIIVDIVKELKSYIKKQRKIIIDDITHDIGDDLGDVYDDLLLSNVNIADDLSFDLGIVQSGFGILETGILTDIMLDIQVNADTLANIQTLLDTQVDFSGLIEPFGKIFSTAIGLGKETLISTLLSSFSQPINIVGKIDAIDKLIPKIDNFDDFIIWANEAWSLIFGLRPFNIWIGKKDWVDKDKRGLYYDVMRFIAFSYIAYKVGFSAIESFFGKMIEQKINEHYAYSKLGIMDYQKLDFRGSLESNELKEVGNFLGYNERTIELVKKNSKFYPTVRDIIDFAVREAFESPGQLFIHGGNSIPIPFSEYADKLGIDNEWIERFWHSHWRLLGSSQILDAFHRKLISQTDLLDYLRRLDYVEKDRKIIMDMSYNLLTRVDIRRIFENGLINSIELYEYYGTLGFKPKDQMLMTQLAKQLRFIDTNDLRKIYIERYENGLITESEIKSLLHTTGLDSDEINQYLYLSDTEKELEFTLELKKRIELKFYEGDIDFDELIQQLRALGVSDQELRRIKKHAILFDFRKKKLPTISELKRYYKKHIIDLSKFVYYALRIGYETEHIYWILTDMEA